MIYFIRAELSGAVKIGWTANKLSLGSRIVTLRTPHTGELKVIRTIPGDRSFEKWLHGYFRTLHISGEWFTFDREMMTVRSPGLRPNVAEVRRFYGQNSAPVREQIRKHEKSQTSDWRDLSVGQRMFVPGVSSHSLSASAISFGGTYRGRGRKFSVRATRAEWRDGPGTWITRVK